MIHILQCENFDDELRLLTGGDFGQLYKRKLENAGATDCKVWDVVKGDYPEVKPGDSLVITGSTSDSFRDDQWILDLVEFLKLEIAKKTRVVGICFGHQIMARALGANVGRGDGWELGTLPIQPTALAKKMFPDLGSAPEFYQFHQDEVKEVPPGYELLFTGSGTKVQGLLGDCVLTTQFHPEFTYEVMHSLCRHLPNEQQIEAIGALKHEHAGATLIGYLRNFLEFK